VKEPTESSGFSQFVRLFDFEFSVRCDDHAVGLKGQFIFGGLTDFAVNEIDNELEVREVTGQRLLDDESGDSLGVPTLAREKRAASTNERREESLRRKEERWRRAVIRAQEKANRRAERDKAYRAMGIEPGPWAWYHALSEVQQAVVLGLAFGLPAGAILIAIFAIPKLLGGR
jgi:hypothetical protein